MCRGRIFAPKKSASTPCGVDCDFDFNLAVAKPRKRGVAIAEWSIRVVSKPRENQKMASFLLLHALKDEA